MAAAERIIARGLGRVVAAHAALEPVGVDTRARRELGKRRCGRERRQFAEGSCYIGGTSAYALLAIALPCVHALDLLPPAQSAQFAAIVLGSAIVSGLLSAAAPVFIGAMIADVIDVDETATGRRRAASFFGTAAIVAKPAVAVSTVLAGALLAVIGLDGGAGGGAPQSSLPLGLLSGALVALFALTAALSMRRYAPAA